MKKERSRFEWICKKSMGHRNPLISSRRYEIGPKKEEDNKNKMKSHTKTCKKSLD